MPAFFDVHSHERPRRRSCLPLLCLPYFPGVLLRGVMLQRTRRNSVAAGTRRKMGRVPCIRSPQVQSALG